MMHPIRPTYRAGCCIQCGRKIRNFDKADTLFYNSEGLPVYLHPGKCTTAYNENEVSYYAANRTSTTKVAPPMGEKESHEA